MPPEPVEFDASDSDLMSYANLIPGRWYGIEHAVRDEDVDANVFVYVPYEGWRGQILAVTWDKVHGWMYEFDNTELPVSGVGEPSHVMFVPAPKLD